MDRSDLFDCGSWFGDSPVEAKSSDAHFHVIDDRRTSVDVHHLGFATRGGFHEALGIRWIR